jgi:hypothetical protein
MFPPHLAMMKQVRIKKRGAPATRTIRTTIVPSELLVNDLCSERINLVKSFIEKSFECGEVLSSRALVERTDDKYFASRINTKAR